jgi:hypothetical protein
MVEDLVHAWAQAFITEQAFGAFLCLVLIGAAAKAAVLGWYLCLDTIWSAPPVDTAADTPVSPRVLRDAELRFLWTWRRCDALVRSTGLVLCPTLVATAWFAGIDFLDLLGAEYGDAYPTRDIGSALLIAAGQVSTRLAVALGLVAVIAAAWVAAGGLLRRRRAAFDRALGNARRARSAPCGTIAAGAHGR